VRELGSTFELNLSPTLLFDYPTVNALTAHLCDLVVFETGSFSPSLKNIVETAMVWHTPVTDPKKLTGNIVCLQVGTTNEESVIFVYGNQGLLVGKETIGHFHEAQPVYSLQAPELTSKIEFVDFEQRAHFHMTEICNFFSGKRVHLVGFSLGGFLAALIASDMQRHGMDCTLTLIDPIPLTKMPMPSLSDAIEMRRFWMQQVHPDLETIVSGRQKTDMWNEDVAILKALDCDEELVDSIRKYLNSILSISSSLSASMSRAGSYEKYFDFSSAIFVLDQGKAFYEFLIPNMDNSDGAYGWSKSLRKMEICNVPGGHFDFFKSKANVNSLVAHLMGILETSKEEETL
jgi:thioesterase domain-containing protein